jgi:hypothetical protein
MKGENGRGAIFDDHVLRRDGGHFDLFLDEMS